jgi:hypothetical protein
VFPQQSGSIVLNQIAASDIRCRTAAHRARDPQHPGVAEGMRDLRNPESGPMIRLLPACVKLHYRRYIGLSNNALVGFRSQVFAPVRAGYASTTHRGVRLRVEHFYVIDRFSSLEGSLVGTDQELAACAYITLSLLL